jgi:RNA polymerase sigma-70 factor (ECF subfamily)
MHSQQVEVTGLLQRWRDGDRSALERLVPLIQHELNRIARWHLMRERKGQSIEASSLVQETFVRLLPDLQIDWRNRAHFFAVASGVMRHILVDRARRRRREKRGGGAPRVTLDGSVIASASRFEDILAIDLALERLAVVDERKSKVVEMRLFGGLGTKEIAEAIGVAPNTVLRDWNFARAWLRRELRGAIAAKGV